MRRMTLSIALVASLGLSGCVSFLPNQKADIAKNLNDVRDQIAKMRATVAVDSPASTSYSKLEPLYISTLASLAQAENAAKSRQKYSGGQLSQLPAENSVKTIRNCREAVEMHRQFIKTDGVPPNENTNIDILESNCDIPRMIESLFRK